MKSSFRFELVPDAEIMPIEHNSSHLWGFSAKLINVCALISTTFDGVPRLWTEPETH
jgi:hypothetical protein